MTTERLYYTDSYLRSFRAQVVDSTEGGRVLYLNHTAFYPVSGGQPFDLGTIAGVPVESVTDEEDRIAHRLSSAVEAAEVECEIDWQRRFDHMQQHTGQHLLSAVFADLLGWDTISFHLGLDISTIDLAVSSVQPVEFARVECRANEVITENRPVFVTSEDASAEKLRKPTDRSGIIRVVNIDGLDRSACGGTHVRATGEIGCIHVRNIEKVRGNIRVYFVAGSRAVSRARKDYEALTAIGRRYSAALDDAPALVESTLTRVEELEKVNRKLSAEIAGARGRALYDETQPSESGVRVLRKIAALTDDLRTEAQAFSARPNAVFLAWQQSPPSVLLACSTDSGLHAGNALKTSLAAYGGRGGGSATLAQGSVPERTDIAGFVNELESRLLNTRLNTAGQSTPTQAP